jgi:hypothetical protein
MLILSLQVATLTKEGVIAVILALKICTPSGVERDRPANVRWLGVHHAPLAFRAPAYGIPLAARRDQYWKTEVISE